MRTLWTEKSTNFPELQYVSVQYYYKEKEKKNGRNCLNPVKRIQFHRVVYGELITLTRGYRVYHEKREV